MRITEENIDRNYESLDDRDYVRALMKDIAEINEVTGLDFFIDFQDYHDEYSPERTDPCPDYFGFVRLKEAHMPPGESLGGVVTLDELDTLIYTVHSMSENFVITAKENYASSGTPFNWVSTMTTDILC